MKADRWVRQEAYGRKDLITKIWMTKEQKTRPVAFDRWKQLKNIMFDASLFMSVYVLLELLN